jgi:NADH-quinone oxidoreductase subunit E
MEIKFTEDNLKKLEEIKSRYPDTHSALMPALWLAQEQFGWISAEIMTYVGKLLNIPTEHILGVVKFYTMYNTKPVGKHHLQVCTNVSCMLKGGYDVLDYISQKLNIKTGETSADGKFTLTEVECLGSCGTAPMLQVNNYFEEDLTKEKIDKLISELSDSNE